MTNSDAIRAAIEVLADEAHPPQRIRARLDARLHHYRQRRLLLRVAGAAAVAGVGGVEAYRLTHRDDPGFPTIVGGPGGGWLRAEPRWRPTWLPGGFGLTGLGAVVDADTAVLATRAWTRPRRANERSDPFVSVSAGPSDAYAGTQVPIRTEQVTIHGVQGQLATYPDESGVVLSWRPPGEPRLIVSSGLYDPEQDRAVALRVARSLRRDPSTIPIGPHPGPLPSPYTAQPWMFNLTGVDDAWWQSVVFRTPATELSVDMGPKVPIRFDRNDADKVSVGGVDGWLDPQGGGLFMSLPAGYNVSVNPDLGPVDVQRLAEAFDFGPIPDMTWYGSR